MSPTQKSVLMAVAWYASDDGEYWGSVSTICEHTCLSERAVRKTLHDLTSMGYLVAEMRSGTSTKYTVTPASGAPLVEAAPCTPCTPAQSAPLQGVQDSPAQDAPPPLHLVHPTPARRAPNKQLTTNTATSKQQPKGEVVALPDWLPERAWQDFVEFRKAIKKPMTPKAQELAIGELGKLKGDGQDPVSVIHQSIVRNWAGLFALKEQQAGQPKRHSEFDKRDYREGANDF